MGGINIEESAPHQSPIAFLGQVAGGPMGGSYLPEYRRFPGVSWDKEILLIFIVPILIPGSQETVAVLFPGNHFDLALGFELMQVTGHR